jgi:DNA invertase Pin-like site-specific DNA recombinase
VEQALGTSLQDQQDAIERYAASKRLKVSRFYVESESGIHEKIERREQMRALMADVRAGDLVLCDKLDRWSRDPEFTYGSVRKILAAGASFYAVGDACDPSTSEGDTALGFRILFAREEHKRIKQRMVGTRKLLRDRGYYVEGPPPFGYRRNDEAKTRLDRNVLVIVPKEAAVVRKVFALYTRGRTMLQIVDEMGLRLDTVKLILHRRTYLGEIETSKGWIRGHHEPIVDAATFQRARELAAARRRGGTGTSETSTWILRDIARCGRCGAKMSAAYGRKSETPRRYYYRCAHHCESLGTRATNGSHVPVRPVEEEAAAMVVERLEEVREALAAGPAPEPRRKVVDLATKRAELDKRRERLLMSFEDGHTSRERLRDRMAALDAERLRLDAQEAAAGRPRPTATVYRETLREVSAVRKAWRLATPEVQRRIVGMVAVAFLLENGKPPEPRWRSVEDLVERR